MRSQSRRTFLATTVLGLGAATRMPVFSKPAALAGTASRLPGEVWIATFGQDGLANENQEALIRKTLSIMECLFLSAL